MEWSLARVALRRQSALLCVIPVEKPFLGQYFFPLSVVAIIGSAASSYNCCFKTDVEMQILFEGNASMEADLKMKP